MRESLPVACDPLCSFRETLSSVSRWQFLKLLAKPAFVTSRADLQPGRLLASPPASLPPAFRCTEPRGRGRRTAQGVSNADSSNKPKICEHWNFWEERVFYRRKWCVGGFLEVQLLVSWVYFKHQSILRGERNDYTEKELSQLFFKRRNFTFVSLPNCASSLLPLPGVPHWTRLPGSASGPSGAVCGVPGAERGNRVTGNRECSRRDCSVSRVAKLFDLLTHFIGIRKTT